MLIANTHSQNSTGQRVKDFIFCGEQRSRDEISRQGSFRQYSLWSPWGSGSSPSFLVQFPWIRLAASNILGISATGPEVPVHHKTCANPSDFKPD